MATVLRAVYEKKVAELAKANKVKVMTVPWHLGAPSLMEMERINNLHGPEKQKHKAQLQQRMKNDFPYRDYPCNMTSKGLGWCQLWFLEESVKLEYCIFGMNHISIDVKVTSRRADGKVKVWARSEEFDPEDKCLKLQPEDEGYPFMVTVNKARAIIKANRKNWLEYNIAMLKFLEKEEQKLAKKRLSPADRVAKALVRMSHGPAVSAPKTARNARTRKRLHFPRAISTKTPPVAKKTRLSTGTNAMKVRLSAKQTPGLKKKIRDKEKFQTKVMAQNREYTKLEYVFHGNKSWAANLKEDPHQLLQYTFEVFKVHGDVDLLYKCCMRLLNQCDDGIKFHEAEYWRKTTKTLIRERLSKNSDLLNTLNAEIHDLKGTPKGWQVKRPKRPRSVDVAHNKGPSPKPRNEEVIIDLASPSKADTVGEKRAEDKGPDQRVKVKGPDERANAKAANGKGPEQPVNAKGPEQPATDKGPEQPATDKGPDFKQADQALAKNRHIPKSAGTTRHFRKYYPHGYPDDANFVRHPHYIVSQRHNMSGYMSVMVTAKDRDKKWRVKIEGHTVGRYHTKAEACEVAYWQHKQARQMKEFLSGEVPSAMFEGDNIQEIGPTHHL